MASTVGNDLRFSVGNKVTSIRVPPSVVCAHPAKRAAFPAITVASSPTQLRQGASSRRPAFLSAATSDANATSDAAPATSGGWVPVIPVEALPRGERRLVRQEGQTILLLWYRNEIYALESTSPAEGAYSEGFINAKLTQDGCIVCPTTDSTFDLKTGQIRDWYPKNPVLRFLTRPTRQMEVYPVKLEAGQVSIALGGAAGGSESAELVFGGDISVGKVADDVAVDEVRMMVDESEGGFGFTRKNELVNGRAAMAGFALVLVIEVITGKGFLATTGFLDFLYSTVLKGGPVI